MVILKVLDLDGNAEYVRADHIINVAEGEVRHDDKYIRATVILLNKRECDGAVVRTALSASSVAHLWAWGLGCEHSGVFESDGDNGSRMVF